MGDSLNFGRELVKVGVSLALVLGLLALAAYGMKRFGKWVKRSENGSRIQVLEQRPVGLKHHLLLVKVQERVLLLGLSPQGINYLSSFEQPPEPSAPQDETT